MRNVTLIDTDIATTALGFGTASLMGKIGRRESLRLLEIAYENGVRHFDTAPLYGDGDSEAVLGEFLQSRSDATIATKFGLRPPAQTGSLLFRRGKQFVRPILRAFPSLRARARRAVSNGSRPASNFDSVAAADSLALSLRRLRREYIDVFLLHECRESDLQDDRLRDFLSLAKDRGQIRAFGVATDVATVEFCVEKAPWYAAVVQLANNRAAPNLERNPALAAHRACVTHSPLGGVGRAGALNVRSALHYAAQHNPNGIILFSSQSVQHTVDTITSFE